MNPVYEEYFANRIRGLRNSPLERFGPRNPSAQAWLAARDAVDAVEDRTLLRGDAVLILRYSLDELVARPLLTVGRYSPDELQYDLAADAQLIASRAREMTDGDRISAHTVVDATSQLWDGLRTGRLGVWDGRG